MRDLQAHMDHRHNKPPAEVVSEPPPKEQQLQPETTSYTFARPFDRPVRPEWHDYRQGRMNQPDRAGRQDRSVEHFRKEKPTRGGMTICQQRNIQPDRQNSLERPLHDRVERLRLGRTSRFIRPDRPRLDIDRNQNRPLMRQNRHDNRSQIRPFRPQVPDRPSYRPERSPRYDRDDRSDRHERPGFSDRQKLPFHPDPDRVGIGRRRE